MLVLLIFVFLIFYICNWVYTWIYIVRAQIQVGPKIESIHLERSDHRARWTSSSKRFALVAFEGTTSRVSLGMKYDIHFRVEITPWSWDFVAVTFLERRNAWTKTDLARGTHTPTQLHTEVSLSWREIYALRSTFTNHEDPEQFSVQYKKYRSNPSPIV